MWSVARRPRWIAALVFALLLAAGFAALSQWQLARSISTGTVVKRDTETVIPLEKVAKPQSPVTDASTAQLVRATGHWVAGDYVLLSDRVNGNETGFWVVGHFVVDSGNVDSGKTDGAGLPVALGWAPDQAAATSALRALPRTEADSPVTISGRYFPSEGPQDGKFEQGKLSTLSAGAMINLWKDADPAGVYGGYLVMTGHAAGLSTITSPAPDNSVEVNLLNIFYAIEWVVFAGFALFLWFRLVKDAWEREQEELAEVN